MYYNTFCFNLIESEVFFCVKYFNELSYNGVKVSIDNLVMEYKISYAKGSFDSDYILKAISGCSYDFQHWTSNKLGACREQFIFKCSNGNTFWLGVGMNTISGIKHVVRIDYNPNKVYDTLELDFVLSTLTNYTVRCDCVRFDLAFDFPIPRRFAFLVKDKRKYEAHSNNCKYLETEYLGARSAPGRVKLYDKTAESNLNYPCTRLEITLDGSLDIATQLSTYFPHIYVLNDFINLDFSVLELNDTELFLLEKLLEKPSDIKRLGRVMQKKIEPVLSRYTNSITFDDTFRLKASCYATDCVKYFCEPYTAKFKHDVFFLAVPQSKEKRNPIVDGEPF